MELFESFFSIEKNKKIVLMSFVITCFVCFASYSAFIVNGFVCPDGILEGMHTYINRDWAIGGCGRWALALVNMAHGNLVFHWLTIIECTIVNWLSIHIINKIIGNNNKYLYCISCALFSIIPPIVVSYSYIYLAFPYCLSILLSVLFVYLNLQNNYYLSLLASISLGFAMGCYQAQIGVSIGLTVICIIRKIIKGDEDVIKFFIVSLISGFVAAIVYVLGLNICLKAFNLQTSSRVANFSISFIINNLPRRFLEMYKAFFPVFLDLRFKRCYIFLILSIILVFEIFGLSVKMIKNRKVLPLIIVLVLILVLPVCFNFIGLLFPKEEIDVLLNVPEYVALMTVIFLKEYLYFDWNKIVTGILAFCLLFLSWSFVLSANSTFDCYRMSYNIYKERISSALDEVFKLDGYSANNTRIVIIGYPSDDVLRTNLNMYYYAEDLHFNLMYWGDTNLDPRATYQYLLNEFGIDGGVMEYEEYKKFKNLDECRKMPVWPKEGYVQMINDCAVIKFSDIYE